MELQSIIQQELSIRLSTLELMKGNSLQKMAAYICNKHLDAVTNSTSSAGDGSIDPAATKRGNNEAEAELLEVSTGNELIDGLDEDRVDNLLHELQGA